MKVARVGNTAVGYALIHWRLNGKSARLYSLAVLERWRQNGIGEMLVNAMRNSAAHEGKRLLSLEVRANKPNLIGFYQGLGFAVQRRLPAYHEDGADALIPAAPTAYSSIHIGHPVHILCRMTLQRQQSANRQFDQLYRLDIEQHEAYRA